MPDEMKRLNNTSNNKQERNIRKSGCRNRIPTQRSGQIPEIQEICPELGCTCEFDDEAPNFSNADDPVPVLQEESDRQHEIELGDTVLGLRSRTPPKNHGSTKPRSLEVGRRSQGTSTNFSEKPPTTRYSKSRGAVDKTNRDFLAAPEVNDRPKSVPEFVEPRNFGVDPGRTNGPPSPISTPNTWLKPPNHTECESLNENTANPEIKNW